MEDTDEFEDLSAGWSPAHFYDGSLELVVPPDGTDQANFDVSSR